MGVKCEIVIKAHNGAFRPGQLVQGTVRYFINKPTKFRTIDITFLGNGICHWIDAGHQYENEEDYVKVNKNFHKTKLDQEVFISGSFEYPFEFLLPNDIPSSVKYNIRCKIEYKIIVTFVKAQGLTTIHNFTKEIPVYGYVKPCSTEPWIFKLQKNILDHKTNFEVKAKIEKTFLTPGEDIRLRLAVNNNSDALITIKAVLIEYFRFVSEDKRTHESARPIKERSICTVENSMSEITCIVPTLPNSYSIQHANILTRGYKLRVTAKLPDLHADAEEEVPIAIGEKKEHLQGADRGNESNSSSSKAPRTDDCNLSSLTLAIDDFNLIEL